MTYRGHQKAIASLLAALGLGGAGYGTHTYIRYNPISTNSVATRLHNATSTIPVPLFTAVPESNVYTTDGKTNETEVLIEIESLRSMPPNTAFRKQGFGGYLFGLSIIVGFASLFFSAVRNVGAPGWVTCGLALLALLATLYPMSWQGTRFRGYCRGLAQTSAKVARTWDTVFQPQNAYKLRNWLIAQHSTQKNTQMKTGEKDAEIAWLKSDLNAAQSMIGAIHQVVDPDSTSPETKILDLVRSLDKSRKLSDKQGRDAISRNEMNIVGEKANLDQVENRIKMLEEINRRLKGDLKQSEDEIARLIEQGEIDKANYNRKKEHYKAVAHYVVSTNDATKITEQTTEDSLQKRLRGIMTDHNENLSTLQQDNEALRTQLAIARQHQAGMAQKLTKFDQETIQQNMAIEAEVKRLRENENTQLLRTQKLEDASAEREAKLRDQLEKVQNDKMTEVEGCEKKIRALREEMKTLENEKNVTLGDLQKHIQDLERNLDGATQERHASISTAKTENEALKSSIFASLQKEGALTKTNTELQARLHTLEIELTRKLEDKETQVQKERLKYDNLRAWVKSKVKKPLQEDTTEHLANENSDLKQQSPASETASQGARPQRMQADNEGSYPQNIEIGSVEPQHTAPQTDFTATRPKQEDVPALQKKIVPPIYAPESPTHAPRPQGDQPTGSQSRDVPIVDDSASHVQQERPVKLKAQVDELEREKAGSSFSTTQDTTIDFTNPTQKQPIFTMQSANIPGLHPTAPQANSTENPPAPSSSDPTEPPPILLNFDPVEFTASIPTTPQPPTPTEQSPHSTNAPRSTSTPTSEPKYLETLPQTRRNTEAEIGARPKLQPRRRNQTISQTAPRNQSPSSTLQFDPRALLVAMVTPPAAAPIQLDALEVYDEADALAKSFMAQVGSSGGATPARPNIFEGKIFDINIPHPSLGDADVAMEGGAGAQLTGKKGNDDDDEDEVDWDDAL